MVSIAKEKKSTHPTIKYVKPAQIKSNYQNAQIHNAEFAQRQHRINYSKNEINRLQNTSPHTTHNGGKVIIRFRTAGTKGHIIAEQFSFCVHSTTHTAFIRD
jgi:hypothetical protein